MDIKIKDIIGIGLASLLLFPVVFIMVLLTSGVAHIEIGQMNSDTKQKLAGYLERMSPDQQNSDLEQTKLFEANQRKQVELDAQEAKIREEASRLESLKLENARLREEIAKDRGNMETLVDQSKQLSNQKVEELAQVYGAMKPVEAAPILLNLDDVSIAKILKRVPETRSQAKLLAALGASDPKRAAEITRILGLKNQAI